MRLAFGMVVIASFLIPMPAGADTGCILYQHRDYGGAYWYMARNSFMQMGGGEPMGATGMIDYYRPDWNDHVSSFRVVGPRCTMTLYQHAGTWGYGARFRSSRSYLYVGSSWNDQASWAVCSCIGPPQH
jgi:syncollin